MKDAGLSQRTLAERTGMRESTISAIMKGRNPRWNSVERLVNVGIRTTWGNLFDEPRIQLTVKDAALAHEFSDFLTRLLATDAGEKKRRSREAGTIDDTLDRGVADEVEELPDEPIIPKYDKKGANRVYRVRTEAMTGVGLFPDAVIFARASRYLEAADDKIAVVRLEKRLFLRRVDQRGNQTVLRSANEPRYGEILVLPTETCELVAIVID